MQTLRLEDEKTGDFPGLMMQSEPGSPPDYSMELYRLYLADQSNVSFTLEEQPNLLRHGQLLTLSPGEAVNFDAGQSVLSLSFHHDFFCVRVQRDEVYCDGVVFNRLTGLPIVSFPDTEQPIVRANLEELKNILEKPTPFSRERALNALRALLLHAADCKLTASNELLDDDNMPAKLSELVLSFQHLVEDTYAQRKDASFYSESLGVTLTTLNRRVKSELGQTVMEVVNERLAIAARVALRSGERSIKEVAFDLGFTDPLYFSRFFKKHFGSSPSHYFRDGVSRDE